MSESIGQRLNALRTDDDKELRHLFDAILTDMTALRTSVVGITAKLDADVGVTDTDYAATHDPAALNITE